MLHRHRRSDGCVAAQFQAALASMHPRYYATEPGYQGELLRTLNDKFHEFSTTMAAKTAESDVKVSHPYDYPKAG